MSPLFERNLVGYGERRMNVIVKSGATKHCEQRQSSDEMINKEQTGFAGELAGAAGVRTMILEDQPCRVVDPTVRRRMEILSC